MKKKLFHELAEKYRKEMADPPCSHFGSCGGCSLQDIPREEQLRLKREYLNRIFDGICEFGPVHPAAPYRYRNRMDFVTAFGKIGLRRAGDYRTVIDIESCEIMQERSNELFQKIRPLLAGIDYHDYLTHEGYLRYVVLRQGRFTGDLMLNFVVAERDNRLRDAIEQIYDHADSISLLLNEGKADLSFGEVIEVVKKGTIEESLDGIRYIIAPNTFFQANSEITLAMYRRIKEEVRGTVLDLYAGVGGITLFIADSCERVTGVESLPESVTLAEENRLRNGIGNADFVCADARAFVREAGPYDTVVLDPPRTGVHPKMIKHLNRIGAGRIIYMSCNPASFKEDLLALTGYTVEFLEAYDMFPQTPHLETLAVLRRV